MNRQFNYIISASLFLLLVFAGILFVKKISSAKPAEGDITGETNNSKTELPLTPGKSAAGKILFFSKCASCHSIFKDMTGPGLIGFEERGPWSDRKKVYEWIKNPSAFMKNDLYTKELTRLYGSMMTGFPDITNEEIDAICDYLNQPTEQRFINTPTAKR